MCVLLQCTNSGLIQAVNSQWSRQQLYVCRPVSLFHQGHQVCPLAFEAWPGRHCMQTHTTHVPNHTCCSFAENMYIYQITDTTADSACTTVECTFQAELGSATCCNHRQSGDAVVVLELLCWCGRTLMATHLLPSVTQPLTVTKPRIFPTKSDVCQVNHFNVAFPEPQVFRCHGNQGLVGATGDSLQETSQGLCCAGSPGALSMVRCSLVWPISDGHVHTWKQMPNPSNTISGRSVNEPFIERC